MLTRCQDSIFCQHTDYTYEVILVDDGGTDNSVELIKARNEKNIRLYQQQNAGSSVAGNKGLELAQGEYVAFMDADIWKLFYERCYRAFDECGETFFYHLVDTCQILEIQGMSSSVSVNITN